MTTRRAAGDALDVCLVALASEPGRHDLGSVLGRAPADLAERAVDHGVAGLAHRHARHLAGQFPDLVSALDAARRDAWSNHLTKLADLALVAAALAPLEGRWAVVKGPVLAERTYGRGDLRSYFDVDLLVHPAAYGTALSLLEDAGAVLLDRNWELIRSSMRAELSLEVAGRTTLDLHWHLLNEAPLRRRATWDMDALLRRTKVADVGGLQVPVLDDVDALLHVAAHACLSGAHRMVWLKDVEQQQRAFPVDPAVLEARARGAGLWPAVHLALLRSARTFGAPAPDGSPAWSRLNSQVGADVFRTSGPVGDGRTLAGATRGTLPASLAAVGRTVLRDQALPHGRQLGLARLLPPAPPTLEDLRRPGGTSHDREAYLAAVAA